LFSWVSVLCICALISKLWMWRPDAC
jgi:hypothetical protein